MRAVFPDVYAIITRRVKAAIEDTRGPVFLEPSFICKLAGRFCQLYLSALESSLAGQEGPCSAWRAAAGAARRRHVSAARHALLGINAHINYDLALGLHASVCEEGAARDGDRLGRFRHDHDAVNGILEASMPEILELLAGRYGCRWSRMALRATRLRRYLMRAMLGTLHRWRDRVWGDLLDLLQGEQRHGAVKARMQRRAGRVSLALGAGVPACRIQRAA